MTLPESLFRFGIHKRVEIRVGASSYTRETGGAAGWSDPSFGAKIKVFEEKSWRPAIAFLPAVSMPWGQAGFSSSAVDASIVAAAGKSLPAQFGVNANFVVSSATMDSKRQWQRGASVSFSREISRRISGFWEVVAQSGVWLIDTGLVQPLGADAQMDVKVGRSVAGAETSWFMGFGFALRQPFRALRRGLYK